MVLVLTPLVCSSAHFCDAFTGIRFRVSCCLVFVNYFCMFYYILICVFTGIGVYFSVLSPCLFSVPFVLSFLVSFSVHSSQCMITVYCYAGMRIERFGRLGGGGGDVCLLV